MDRKRVRMIKMKNWSIDIKSWNKTIEKNNSLCVCVFCPQHTKVKNWELGAVWHVEWWKKKSVALPFYETVQYHVHEK
jgi:hypothetical protein